MIPNFYLVKIDHRTLGYAVKRRDDQTWTAMDTIHNGDIAHGIGRDDIRAEFAQWFDTTPDQIDLDGSVRPPAFISGLTRLSR